MNYIPDSFGAGRDGESGEVRSRCSGRPMGSGSYSTWGHQPSCGCPGLGESGLAVTTSARAEAPLYDWSGTNERRSFGRGVRARQGHREATGKRSDLFNGRHRRREVVPSHGRTGGPSRRRATNGEPNVRSPAARVAIWRAGYRCNAAGRPCGDHRSGGPQPGVRYGHGGRGKPLRRRRVTRSMRRALRMPSQPAGQRCRSSSSRQRRFRCEGRSR